MTRWLAGIYDPSGRTDCARLVRALAPHPSAIASLGPLQVAYTDTAATSIGAAVAQAGPDDPLCLFDGHLDNAAALGAALDEQAHDLRDSPEQLLAAGWRRWGCELLPRLRGDFVLLIWDRDREQGLLARDQLGARSLFLYELDGAICFANEIRYLLELLPRRPSPDRVGLAYWVAGRGRSGPGTLYEGVRRLEPGSTLQLGPHGERCERRYWLPRYREPVAISGAAPDPELHRQVRDAIDLAVRRRLSPEGITCVTMSGGLDSAAVAASARVQAPDRVAAYCGVFPEHPAVDESELIDLLRRELRLPGVTAEVRAGGLLASALESQEAWRVPLVGWGDFWAVPLLREAASAGMDTVLGGDGGDELFEVRSYLLADRVRAGHPVQALRLLRQIPGAANNPSPRDLARVGGKLGLVGALPYRLHRLLSRPLAARQYPGWLCAQATHDLVASDDSLAWKRLDGPRWWAPAAHMLTRGIEELGVFEELRRTAMLAGMQARHPLLDLDLVELVLSQPPQATFDPRLNRPVLRASMAGRLPDTVRLRPRKALFDSLIDDSLMGADGDAVRKLLTAPGAEISAVVDLDAVRNTLLGTDPSRAGRPFRHTQYTWRLVTAECWLQILAGANMETLRAKLRPSPSRVSLRARPRHPQPRSYFFST